MTIHANNFLWVNKDETPKNTVQDILENIKDTDDSKESTDSRLLPENTDILLTDDGTLRLKRSQYTETMVGVDKEKK